VAAAVTEALQPAADLGLLMRRMLAALETMHDRNPSWGPLYVAHPGDVVAWEAYAHSARGTGGRTAGGVSTTLRPPGRARTG
jgi:hypothetical protein